MILLKDPDVELTQQQNKAINESVVNMRLIACAASGKTEAFVRCVVKLFDPKASDKSLPPNIRENNEITECNADAIVQQIAVA